MKVWLLIALALSTLAGCVVAPAGPDYGYPYRYDRYGYYAYPSGYVYASPAYPYGYGYYRHRYYWRQSP